MSTPFLSEIKLVAFNFAPKGWALCNGQLLPINQNQALFSLLGTTYGGDGRVNFGLPDLRGRVPMHTGAAHTLGERGGEEAHTLALTELPAHTHVANASSTSTGGNVNPTNNLLGGGNGVYHSPVSVTPLYPATIGNTGGSQPHANMAPFLTLNFCIALQGIFPSQN